MTEAAALPSQTHPMSLPPDNDNHFGFLLKDWNDFPDTDIPPEYLPETQNERVKRIYEETGQRNETTPTAWHRFSTLGRNIVSFLNFEAIWNNFDNDQLQLHLVVWYRYMYYIDRKLDVPKKLHDWANNLSLPYLSTHTDKVLPVDTTTIGFGVVQARQQYLLMEQGHWICEGKAPHPDCQENLLRAEEDVNCSQDNRPLQTTTCIHYPPIPEELDDEQMDVEIPGVRAQTFQTPAQSSKTTPPPHYFPNQNPRPTTRHPKATRTMDRK
ncbi:hypothetical protein MHU86_25471 [Fragilaria crotonensis]|nr:hypothetical protein MHU86_25471 [Fragilaria crotonensis]